MVAKAVEDALRVYEIGEKLRALRLRKKMGLVELASHTGLSPALLSKVERSKLFPPLPTLVRIAMVFGVGLEYFFTDEKKRHPVSIVRKADRQQFPDKARSKHPAFVFESLDYPATERPINAYLAEFQQIGPDAAEPHEHDGFELIYLFSGRLAITIGSDEHELRQGDSIYFDSSVRHSYRSAGPAVCRGIVVTTAR